MAETLESFDFNGSGRRSTYPWDKWLDGQIWQLKIGEDFTCKVGSFQKAAGTQARKRGLRLRTAVSGDHIILQAFNVGGVTEL